MFSITPPYPKCRDSGMLKRALRVGFDAGQYWLWVGVMAGILVWGGDTRAAPPEPECAPIHEGSGISPVLQPSDLVLPQWTLFDHLGWIDVILEIVCTGDLSYKYSVPNFLSADILDEVPYRARTEIILDSVQMPATLTSLNHQGDTYFVYDIPLNSYFGFIARAYDNVTGHYLPINGTLPISSPEGMVSDNPNGSLGSLHGGEYLHKAAFIFQMALVKKVATPLPVFHPVSLGTPLSPTDVVNPRFNLNIVLESSIFFRSAAGGPSGSGLSTRNFQQTYSLPISGWANLESVDPNDPNEAYELYRTCIIEAPASIVFPEVQAHQFSGTGSVAHPVDFDITFNCPNHPDVHTLNPALGPLPPGTNAVGYLLIDGYSSLPFGSTSGLLESDIFHGYNFARGIQIQIINRATLLPEAILSPLILSTGVLATQALSPHMGSTSNNRIYYRLPLRAQYFRNADPAVVPGSIFSAIYIMVTYG